MKTFGHMRPVRDKSGNITGSKSSPVKARTVEPLGRKYGPDHDKRLVISLEAKDVIVLRPERTRRAESILATDLYAYLVRLRAQRGTLEKARAAKDRKSTRLARLRQERAEKKLLRPV